MILSQSGSHGAVYIANAFMHVAWLFDQCRNRVLALIRALCRGAGAALVIAGSPVLARAQAIDQYLTPIIPGIDTQPGVTVMSRLHPDYDPIGIRLGLFTLYPSLNEGIGYDDNVTATSPARGSIRIDTDAALSAVALTGNGGVSATISVANSQYPEVPAQSNTDYTASVSATHDFGLDQLYLYASHASLNQTARDLGLPQLDAPIGYRSDDLRAQYVITLGHLQIQPGMDILFYNYDNGSVLGLPYAQSYRDRIVYEPSATVAYEFATGRKLVLVVRDADALYTGALSGQAKEDYNDLSVLAGVSYDLTGVIGLRLLAGYEERHFTSHSYSAIRAPIAEGSLTWTPTDLTTVTGTVTRSILDAAADGTIGYTETAFRLNLDHELLRNVVISGSFTLKTDDYSEGQGSQRLYRAGLGATWRLSRTLSLGANYTFASRRINGTFDSNTGYPGLSAFSHNYTEDVFRLLVKLAI